MWKKDQSVDDATMAKPIQDSGSKMNEQPAAAKERGMPSNQGTAGKKPAGNAQIGEHVIFEGKITGSADVVISGQFKGTISIPEHTVTVEKPGLVEAEITASKVIVRGQVKGDIVGNDMVQIVSKGVLIGNIKTVNVALDTGCDFNGSIEMMRKEPRKHPKPQQDSKAPPMAQATRTEDVSAVASQPNPRRDTNMPPAMGNKA